jgi:hypothetical protein
MRTNLWLALCFAATSLAPLSIARGQQVTPNPRVGYVYPAGIQQGTTAEVTVGGQFLDGVSDVLLTGNGVTATVVSLKKPLTQREINEIQTKTQELQERIRQMQESGELRAQAVRQLQSRFRAGLRVGPVFQRIAQEVGLDFEKVRELAEYRRMRADPLIQENAQIAERVTLRIECDTDAKPGERELRLKARTGLTNPLRFHVGSLPEQLETEPNNTSAESQPIEAIPAIVNGQVLPGDVDRFRFTAKKGERIVLAALARGIMPYLADAVPGWFQATLGLYDAQGTEVAYVDDFLFHPDPVLFCEIEEDGDYVLEIKDAIFRGREDFVYRIAIGELPYVTGMYPLGGRAEETSDVEFRGWNLPKTSMKISLQTEHVGVHPVSLKGGAITSNAVPFVVDTLPELEEQKQGKDVQELNVPVIVNGRIDSPEDADVFRFSGRKGDALVLEVMARRIGSPLDSMLMLLDSDGKLIAANDDFEDKGAGLVTHQADSRIDVTLEKDGEYTLRLSDAQAAGGEAYAYRLRVSEPRPDYRLRVAPSSINLRVGSSLPLTVYALREDGFDGDIAVRLVNAPRGFSLTGGWIPEGVDHVRMTLTAPPTVMPEPVSLEIEGSAVIDGQEVSRRAQPTDDRMQAFIYRHLVPAERLLVNVMGFARARFVVRLYEAEPIEIPVGGSGRAHFVVPRVMPIDELKLELDSPPEGLSISKTEEVRGGIAVELAASDEVEQRLRGNLIVKAYVERVFKRPNGPPEGIKRKIPVGTLPAVPFVVK